MIVSMIVTIISSSSLCKNGCKIYLALLSSSLTVLLANYFLTTAFLTSKGNSYTILLIDTGVSVLAAVYLAFKIPEEDNQVPQREVTITEMKNFKESEEKKIEEEPNETIKSQNYKFYQIALCCYSLYLGMILTNWECEEINIAPMIARSCQSGLLFVFYFWTLIAPVLFPDRDFQ